MPPVRPRGMGPVSPRDFTGKQFATNTKATLEQAATADIGQSIKAAYDRGHKAGFYEGVQWVQDNYDVFELENEDDELGIEVD
jgi:hypothetical protein